MNQAIKDWIGSHLDFPNRLESVAQFYLLSLMLASARHSQTNAQELSGLNKSQFSRLLKEHHGLAFVKHMELVEKTIRGISKQFQKDPSLVSGTPWKIFLIVDSTLHSRTSRHIQNAQKFNHGDAWVTGHQWTNIVIVIGSKIIPLPPIAFHTVEDCKRLGIDYQTEHEKLESFFEELDLNQYLGEFDPKQVAVLMDSGYDNKKLQASILKRAWDFVCALKTNRSVQGLQEQRSSGWFSIKQMFKRIKKQAPWKTVYVHKKLAGTKKQRTEFRARLWTGHLRGIFKPIALICSEKTNGERRYLACSNTSVSLKAILTAYRSRWLIELFHKDVKSYLGMEHAGVREFNSLKSHVHWVYIAFLLMKEREVESETGIRNLQRKLEKEIEIHQLNEWIQTSTQIGGDSALRKKFAEEKQRMSA